MGVGAGGKQNPCEGARRNAAETLARAERPPSQGFRTLRGVPWGVGAGGAEPCEERVGAAKPSQGQSVLLVSGPCEGFRQAWVRAASRTLARERGGARKPSQGQSVLPRKVSGPCEGFRWAWVRAASRTLARERGGTRQKPSQGQSVLPRKVSGPCEGFRWAWVRAASRTLARERVGTRQKPSQGQRSPSQGFRTLRGVLAGAGA